MYEALSALGSVVLDPYLLFLIFATTVIGIVIGVLPGLGQPLEQRFCSRLR